VGNVKLFTLSGDTTGFGFSGNHVSGEAPLAPEGVDISKNTWNEGTSALPALPTWVPMYKSASKMTSVVPNPGQHDFTQYEPRPLEGGQWPFLPEGALRGWKYMLIDEWGPYDFKRPILWPRGQDTTPGAAGAPDTTVRHFEILGPQGSWKVADLKGVQSISAQSGQVPGTVDVVLPAGKASDVKIELDYTGQATTDYRGIVTPAGKAVRFSFEKFFAPIAWNVKFFPWTEATDPRTKPDAFAALIKGQPYAMQLTDKLDYASGGSFVPAAPADHFATVADGTFDITPGTYTVELTIDDGGRVWLDDKPLQFLDAAGKPAETWKYQGPTLYTAEVTLAAGPHKFHVEHFDIDGYSALKLNLKPKK
jgi:hypothetical protein